MTNTTEISPKIKCFNCGENHYVNKCPYTKQEIKDYKEEEWFNNPCNICGQNIQCKHRRYEKEIRDYN